MQRLSTKLSISPTASSTSSRVSGGFGGWRGLVGWGGGFGGWWVESGFGGLVGFLRVGGFWGLGLLALGGILGG